MDQHNFLNVTKRVQRQTSIVQRWQEASEIYLDTEGRGRAMDLLSALSQRVVEDFSPYKLNDLLKDKGAKGKISTQTKGQLISKCLFGVFNFFQKTNKNKSTWDIIVVKLNSFVRFLKEFMDWQFAFEFYWL